MWTAEITVKFTKPWTPEIFMECYCDARNKPIRCKITKPQTASAISLWFWGLLAYPELYCDWPLHNQHSWNFSGVHGFLSLTVNVNRKPECFLNFSMATKCILGPKWQISPPFHKLQPVRSLPLLASYTWRLKKVSLSGRASPYRSL